MQLCLSWTGGRCIRPLYSFMLRQRRSWVVRAADTPPWQKLQHQDGLAVIERATARASEKPRERWQPTKQASFPPLPRQIPKGWAGSSPPAASSTKASPGTKPVEQVPAAPKADAGSAGPDSIAAALAAALAPLQSQIAELQRIVGGGVAAPADVEMETDLKRGAEGHGDRPPMRLRIC